MASGDQSYRVVLCKVGRKKQATTPTARRVVADRAECV